MLVLREDDKLQLCLERDRVLCDPEFARSPTMSKLLRFMVDHKLREESQPLTAYSIAVDALGRDDNFDTQIDSYPRVQVGRLRRMLDHFYLRENSETRLSIPYHNYEIVLGPNEAKNATDRLIALADRNGEGRDDPLLKPSSGDTGFPRGLLSAGRGQSRAALAVMIFAILSVIGVFSYLQQSATANVTSISYPAIIVKESEGVASLSSLAKIQLTHSLLVGRLKKFDQLRVFDEDLDGGSDVDVQSQYSLETSILNEAADSIQLRLVDSVTREVIWSSRIEVEAIDKLEVDLDEAVIAIASPHGKIAQHEMSKYRGDYSPGYPCLLQFHHYMRYRDQTNLEPVLTCMKKSAQQFSDDSYLLSMVAVARNVSKPFGGQNGFDVPGNDFALTASKLNPDSASATFAVAQSAFFKGDCRRGVALGEHAVELNPLNSRIMGHLGLYMLACNIPEGEAYSMKALQMDPDADLAIAAALAMQILRRGDAKAAQQLASKYMDSAPDATPALEISYILSTAMLGDKTEARRSWQHLVERSGLSASAKPREVLGKWIANPLLIRELESDFVKAGFS